MHDEVIFESDYHRLSWLAEGVLALVRSGARIDDPRVMDDEYAALVSHLRAQRPESVFVDLRLARGRNDPEFEARSAAYRDLLMNLAPRVVLLVSTAIGELQVRRHAELAEARGVIVTRDHDEARRLALLPG